MQSEHYPWVIKQCVRHPLKLLIVLPIMLGMYGLHEMWDESIRFAISLCLGIALIKTTANLNEIKNLPSIEDLHPME